MSWVKLIESGLCKIPNISGWVWLLPESNPLKKIKEEEEKEKKRRRISTMIPFTLS